MEFPDLGQHCSAKLCNRLDFLPMKCDACGKILCKDHIHYVSHECQNAYQKNNQVPICPLCNHPVPVKPGEPPDIRVGEHIDRDCRSDQRKVYTNKCSAKGCKQKEMVPISCTQCRKNFCLTHRHMQDHNCKGYIPSGRQANSNNTRIIAGPQNQNRNVRTTTTTDMRSSIQGNLSEDEALAMAMQQSLADEDASIRRTQQRGAMARQASFNERQRRSQRNCNVS